MYRLLTVSYLFLSLSMAASAQLAVDFTADKPGGCSPLVTRFTATVSGAGSGAVFSWDLGNGNSATTTSPQAIYTTMGAYIVTLTVRDGGQTASATHTVTVYAPPVAGFTASANLVCGTPVSFTSTSQAGGTDPGAAITNWLWDYGDGTTQQGGPAVSHVFNGLGKMPVSLTVTDNHGCTASAAVPDMVQVLPRLSAAFTSDKQVLCSVTDPVQFANTSSGPGTLTYNWDFGDGTNSTQPNPSHRYTQQGNYPVRLTVTSSTGCVVSATEPTPLNVANYTSDFSVPSTAICQNNLLSFPDASSPIATSRAWSIDGAPVSTYDPFTYTFLTAGTHTVTLSNVFGTCPQQVSKQVKVNTVPATAPFDKNVLTTCGAPATVNFTDHSPGPGIAAWDWQFLYTYSNGGPSEYKTTSGPTASHTFTENEAYTVQLTVTNSTGCTSSVSEPLFISPPSVTIYEPNPTPGGTCGQPVTKTLAWHPPAVALQSWWWDLGDGSTSTAANPTYTWSQPGQYAVRLHWTDVNGCTGISGNFILVVISSPMTLDFTTTTTTVCAGTTVYFNSPSLAAANPLWSSWNYGDGSPSAFIPQHIYYTPGTYTVTLFAENAGGCTTTVPKTQYITVLQPPGHYGGYTNTCDGTRNTVTFNYSQAGSGSIAWDFGDGTRTTTAGNSSQQQHTYAKSGIYYINVSGSDGTCSTQNSDVVYVLLKQDPQLSAASTTACSSGSLDVSLAIERNPRELNSGYDYDYTPQFYYGDGTPFTGSVVFTNPGQPYSNGAFGWTLTGFATGKSGLYVVTTSFGLNCTDVSNTIPLTIRGSATAGLTVVSDNRCYQQPAVLQDASTAGVNNAIVSWTWDFGDGQTQTAATGGAVTHGYAHPGDYTARLTIKDQGGCVSSTGAGTANVSMNGPQADFSYSPARVLLGNTVYFYNATNTYGAPGTTFLWDFGDGSGSATAYPSHLYALRGTYTVTLTATSGAPGGCVSVTTQQLVVYNFNSHFQIAPGYVTSGQCPPVLAQFTNTSVNYTSVAWDFGDGTTAGNLNYPSHVYTTPGAYQVTLSVYGSGGLIGKYTDSVFVRQPSASLSAIKPAICVNQPAPLQAKAHGALHFVFDFGDGSVSSGIDSNSSHVYAASGNYTVRLVVTDTAGCSVAADAGVGLLVNPLPTVTISPVDPHVCLGSSVMLKASGGSSYSWTPATGLDDPGIASPLASPRVNTPYSVLVTDDNGCQAQAAVSLTVVQPEMLAVSPNSTALCAGDSVALHAKGTDLYQWIGDTRGLNTTAGNNPVAQPPQTVHYQVVGSDAYHCFSDTAAITVTVLPLPTVNGGGNVEVLAGTPVTLAATGSSDVVQWVWTPADYLSCTDCAQPVCTPRRPETYTSTVTNGAGCHARDTVQVKLLCAEARVRIPEAFTPNGDGHNDRFTILGIGEVDHLVIYDRWGVKVYERNHFYTADAGAQWDGTLHGQPAPTGVYAYFVEMSCPSGGVFTRRGTVVLVR